MHLGLSRDGQVGCPGVGEQGVGACMALGQLVEQIGYISHATVAEQYDGSHALGPVAAAVLVCLCSWGGWQRQAKSGGQDCGTGDQFTRQQFCILLQVHAEGEAEHAAIGHDAVVTYVPASHEPILRRAMLDHDRCVCLTMLDMMC